MNSHFIQDRLKQTGKTQEDLGAALGRDRSAVSRIVNERQELTLRQLEPTAAVLGLSVADLLAGLGVNHGTPAVNADLLADCLSIIQRRAADMPPQVQARMTATLYDQARQHPELLASMDATAETLVRFARTGG